MNKFTILGLGWLGYPLSKKLQDKYHIKASVRSEDRALDFSKDINEYFEVFVLNENNLQNLDYLLDTDYLFVNYPPSKFNDYLKFLENIYSHKKVKDIKKIFFISSSSIYPNLDQEFDEEFEVFDSKNSLVFKAEQIVKDETNYILRCSGLMGYNRVGGKYFSNKVVNDPNAYVNYVHRDDVMKAVEFILDNNINDGIYNLVAPLHPTKKEIYTENCKKLNIDLPIFIENNNIFKRKIIGNKIINKGFSYTYNNPLNFK